MTTDERLRLDARVYAGSLLGMASGLEHHAPAAAEKMREIAEWLEALARESEEQ